MKQRKNCLFCLWNKLCITSNSKQSQTTGHTTVATIPYLTSHLWKVYKEWNNICKHLQTKNLKIDKILMHSKAHAD